jgi:aspartate/methionine/tyrosine aminotransferase
MVLKVSTRGAIPPFIVMDVLRAANRRQAEGGDVVHLELGQPSTPAPNAVIAAAQKALAGDQLGYTEALGLAPLRRRISEYYRRNHDINVDPERIVVTTGSSGGFVLSFLAAFDAGDRIALADPGYPAYRNILLALGNEPLSIPTTAKERFQPTPALLDDVDGKFDGLIVASPSNPAGTMLGPAEMEGLVAYCQSGGIRLVSDEIYHGITYGQPGTTALRYTDDALVINSFSKYYSMTGWRVGWMVVPPDLVRAVECLAQNIFISAPTLSQFAAEAAFGCTDDLDRNVARYAENRRLLLEELPQAGFDRLAPADGAFYLYADVAHLTNDSEEFCRRMLAETGVATTPGTDFDQARGRSFVRFSFSGATEGIAEAARRLKNWKRP